MNRIKGGKMTTGELNTILEQRLPEVPVGQKGLFFRAGTLPKSGFSRNYATGEMESGVSVYRTPNPDSLAGMTGRDWYSGNGIVVGRGSDGEPLVNPVGKWTKIFDAKRDSSYGNAANKWAIVNGLISE